ncbi:FCD domain-containing protein [Luteimonas sp. BDR2-5]|uniref:GntR family transcriptional regulator n=1 Tax=Proluteimonas luteida TaxID=2878685 RepID=UPI001E4654D7|nr:FCD domain-containing protein [Luteimonas sp. BDR2-5]MCD9029831.1 FCD domain-containing protein [Luteimonas sp. BDR2-5]
MSQPAKATSARTLARQAYQHIRHDIVAGRLLPGSKLKLESMAQQYQVGMSPLREALARLVGDQLVKTEDQRGFWVAPLSLDELDDISRVRTLVETEALRLSIENGNETWERDVRAAFESLSAVEAGLSGSELPVSQEVLDQWEARNHAFHTALISACDSPWLGKLQELLYHQAERYRRFSLSYSQGRRFVHDEHVAIFEAAIERNAVRACRLTEAHLMRTYDAVRAALAKMEAFSASAA